MSVEAAAAPADPGDGLLVGVVDYGAGNLVSIEQALAAVGARSTVLTTPDALADVDLLLVPGVGAAASAMRRLRRAGLDRATLEWIDGGRPFLGICLGLQLLFERSDEDGARTLGVIPGRTIRLEDPPRLPHIGWNQLEQVRAHPALEGIEADDDVYFVHSFAGVPSRAVADEWVVARTRHGLPFVSAVARGNVLGLQFHPERSGEIGLHVLANVLRWAAGAASRLAA